MIQGSRRMNIKHCLRGLIQVSFFTRMSKETKGFKSGNWDMMSILSPKPQYLKILSQKVPRRGN